MSCTIRDYVASRLVRAACGSKSAYSAGYWISSPHYHSAPTSGIVAHAEALAGPYEVNIQPLLADDRQDTPGRIWAQTGCSRVYKAGVPDDWRLLALHACSDASTSRAATSSHRPTRACSRVRVYCVVDIDGARNARYGRQRQYVTSRIF